jgi:SdrD B-like domain
MRLLLTILWIGFAFPMVAATAQDSNTGAICVLTFEDSNENGTRDEGEVPLAGIAVNIAVQNDVIIRNHITTSEDSPYCFNDLSNGTYTLSFADSPNHRATLQNSTEVTLEGDTIRTEFGAVSLPPFAESVQTDPPLETGSRLLVALLGALLVMLFMAALGGVIAAIFLY